MLHRFATYEEAALFVTLKRDEGHMAEILHDHTAMLWGPLTLGGVAAWVSEEAAGEEDEVPEIGRIFRLPVELSLVLGRMVLAVLAASLIPPVVRMLQNAMLYPMMSLLYLVVMIALVLLLVLFLWFFGWLLSAWTHAIWDEQEAGHRFATGLHLILGWLLALIQQPLILLGAFVLAIWLQTSAAARARSDAAAE